MTNWTRLYHRYSCIGLLLFLILTLSAGLPSPAEASSDNNSRFKLQQAVTESRRTAIVNAVERASPAVVNISAIQRVAQLTSFDEWFWGEIPESRLRSLREVGSGVIVDKIGYILTNHHVVENADRIKVAISDGRELEAHILGYDYLSDLALLKIDTKDNLPQIEWGDSEDLMIGEWVLAIGNPFGLSIGTAQPTVTIGIVSATQRTLTVENRFYESLIQTDASINVGNSGGALVNIHGQLIGINTVIRSTSGGSQGVGFAIPANKVKKVIQQIIEYGSVIPPYLGIETQPVTEELAEKLWDSDSQEENPFATSTRSGKLKTGVLVSQLEKRSPTAAAGIKRGDVIIAIAGHRIKNQTDFKAVARLLPLNTAIPCQLIRHGKKIETTLKLKTLQWEYISHRWGLTLKQPNQQEVRKYKQPGVIIKHIEKNSGLAGTLQRGDFIYQLNDTKINSLEIFKLIDQRIRTRNRVQLYFKRDGVSKSIFVTFNRNNRWR